MREDRTFYNVEAIVPVVTSGGAFAANTLPMNGSIVGVRCKPTTSTTIYDISITDKDDMVIYKRTGVVGTYVETAIGIPVVGVVTVAIESATNDEVMTVVIHADAV